MEGSGARVVENISLAALDEGRQWVGPGGQFCGRRDGQLRVLITCAGKLQSYGRTDGPTLRHGETTSILAGLVHTNGRGRGRRTVFVGLANNSTA